MNQLIKGAAIAALFACAQVSGIRNGANPGAAAGRTGRCGNRCGRWCGGRRRGRRPDRRSDRWRDRRRRGATAGALTADDRVYVQQYVYSRQVEPVVVQQGLAVGQPVPAGVTVYNFEGNPRLATYRYAYVNQQYVLIDANGRVLGAVERQ